MRDASERRGAARPEQIPHSVFHRKYMVTFDLYRRPCRNESKIYWLTAWLLLRVVCRLLFWRFQEESELEVASFLHLLRWLLANFIASLCSVVRELQVPAGL